MIRQAPLPFPARVSSLRRSMAARLLILLACIACIACVADLAAGDAVPPRYTAAECAALQARADALGLDRDPYWRVLLHVVGSRSLVDAPAFFITADGKHDPRAELHADLAAFLGITAAPSADGKDAVERFPARFAWLCAKLGLDRARLPVAEAREFEAALAEFGPRGVALVFPSAYMSTPASMFGHTLLIVRSRYANRLLSQGINYAATTNRDNGFLQAFKGLMGMYPGYYSLLPYHHLVQEYADLDQRDMWEYDLALSEAETRNLMLHVWELRGIWSGYFFFDENCSYNLLYLLDAARPGLDLHAQANPFWVIPLDTVRLVREAGLITGTTFRPSRATRVRHLATTLADADQLLARGLAEGTATTAALADRPPATRARILDLAGEYLQSLRGRGKIPQADYQPRYFATLTARSALDVPPLADQDIAAPTPPELGHDSARITVGGGRAWDTNFAELTLRPAYHDLTDAVGGYQPGTQVEFLNAAMRWYDGDEHPVLERVDAIRLRSFTARDHLYRPISYAVDTGVAREWFGTADAWRYQGYLSGGGGLCWSPWGGSLVDALIETDLRVGGIAERYSAGLGASLGVGQELPGGLLLRGEARGLRQGLGILATNWELTAVLRWAVARNLALLAEGARRERWDALDTAGSVKVLWYF